MFFLVETGQHPAAQPQRNTRGCRPRAVGLPVKSAMGTWVDFDNDGDRFALVPRGCSGSGPDHTFEETGLLASMRIVTTQPLVNWADLDNGRQDRRSDGSWTKTGNFAVGGNSARRPSRVAGGRDALRNTIRCPVIGFRLRSSEVRATGRALVRWLSVTAG